MSSCENKKYYLSAEEKMFLVYSEGELLTLIDTAHNDTLSFPCTYGGFRMSSGVCGRTQYEYGVNHFSKDSCSINLRIEADSLMLMKIEIHSKFYRSFERYYPKYKKMDSLIFNGYKYLNTYRFEGDYGNIYLDTKYGVLKITDTQGSTVFYKPN
jgi:hypothetical protein